MRAWWRWIGIPLLLGACGASPEAGLWQETTLLDHAREALLGEGASAEVALWLTEVHAARSPEGPLGLEREIMAIEALVRIGRDADARARARALLARRPAGLGIFQQRLERLLQRTR